MKTTTLLVAYLVFIGTQAVTVSARADSGVAELQQVNPIYLSTIDIPANATAVVETFALSANSDTVLHVQYRDGQSAPVTPGGDSGNDDCVPGSGLYHSCFTIPTSPQARSLLVIVRSYTDYSPGQARLRQTVNGVVSETVPNVNYKHPSTSITSPHLSLG
jgi:hypothetical protein